MIEFTIPWFGGIHFKIWATQVLGLAAMGLYFWFLWRAQIDEENPIKLQTMLVWPGTQQTSLASVIVLGGAITATWIIVDLALRNHLTPEYFVSYLGVMVFGKGMTEFANAWRDRGPPPPATNTTQNIDKAAVVTSAPAPSPPPAVPTNAAPVAAAPVIRARKRAKPKGKRR